MTLATKTDAKGQVFSYSYDSMNRLTQVSVGGTVLRTYVYDSNTDSPTYSAYTTGRLAEIRYPSIAFTDSGTGLADTNQFTDMFSYTQAGQVAGKQLQVTKTHTYTSGASQHVQNAVGNLNVTYAYNNEGKLTSVTYPTAVDFANNSNTQSFSYTYDQMMRLASMTESNTDSTMNHYTQPVVNGVTYNPASQMTGINYYQASETRTYDPQMLLLTNIATTPPAGGTGINVTYTYPTGSNNGKIASTYDAISIETVTYQYDSLNRLISASGSTSGSTTWTQTQAYDGFGNLTGRTGSAAASGTTISTPVNAATNQLSSYTYDNNGNLLSTGYTYDAENRIEYANSGGVQYFYDGQNKRIWQTTCTSTCSPGSSWTLSAEVINVFGADGKQLASYAPSVPWNNTTTQLTVSFGIAAERAYFGGKLVAQLGSGGYLVSTIQDRLGSTGKYYPYGEERNSPPLANDQVKFATHTRDSATGNDYADQRYYSSALGRFMTPDPYVASGTRKGSVNNPSDPQSWNRYPYTGGDPVNRVDPSGEDYCEDFDDETCIYETDPAVPLLAVDLAGLANEFAWLLTPQGQATIDLNLLQSVGGLINSWSPDGGNFNISVSATDLLTLVEDGFVQANPATIQEIEQGLSEVITLGAAAVAAIGGWWTHTFSKSAWKAGSFPTVQEIQINCTPVGKPVTVPSTNRRNRGGQSIEQQYLCPDGQLYSIHTLVDKNGKIVDIHARGPK